MYQYFIVTRLRSNVMPMHSIKTILLPEVGIKLPGSPGGPGRPTPKNPQNVTNIDKIGRLLRQLRYIGKKGKLTQATLHCYLNTKFEL